MVAALFIATTRKMPSLLHSSASQDAYHTVERVLKQRFPDWQCNRKGLEDDPEVVCCYDESESDYGDNNVPPTAYRMLRDGSRGEYATG
jgi:hypothetical protein